MNAPQIPPIGIQIPPIGIQITPIGIQRYQSPIALYDDKVSFPISQKISVKGKNKNAILDSTSHVYNVKTNVILKIDNIRYKLSEYHFHYLKKPVPPSTDVCSGSEHTINDKRYDAEVHYVFVELSEGQHDMKMQHVDICSGTVPLGMGNFLVIGRLIKFDCKYKQDLANLQVELPSTYFEYDGSLTGADPPGSDDFQAVRWILGNKPLKFSSKLFSEDNAKATRCLQPLDGRLILHSCRH